MTGTFEGVGTLQFTPDNKNAYAYSGKQFANDPEVTILEFTTESYYLVGSIQFTSPAGTSDDLIFRTYLNDIQVSGSNWTDTRQNENINQPVLFIIPPFSTISARVLNGTSSSAREVYAIGTFKVKGPIEQVDLEAITDGSKWAK
jgi:hypothetical protein